MEASIVEEVGGVHHSGLVMKLLSLTLIVMHVLFMAYVWKASLLVYLAAPVIAFTLAALMLYRWLVKTSLRFD